MLLQLSATLVNAHHAKVYVASFLFAGLMFCLGCSSQTTGEVLRTAPASGQLIYKRQPLEHFQVTFFPVDGSRPAIGVSDGDGKFVLGTNQPNDGAVVGKHKVAILYVGPPSTNPEEGMTEFSTPPPPKVKLPTKYSRSETSGIEIDISASGNEAIKIELL